MIWNFTSNLIRTKNILYPNIHKKYRGVAAKKVYMCIQIFNPFNPFKIGGWLQKNNNLHLSPSYSPIDFHSRTFLILYYILGRSFVGYFEMSFERF